MGKSKSVKRANNSGKGSENPDSDVEAGGDRPGWPKVILSLVMGESFASLVVIVLTVQV